MLLLEDISKSIFFFPDGTSPHLEENIFSEENKHQDFTIYQVKDVKNHFPLILFTSGSTGPSKFVLIPNFALQRYGYSFFDKKIERFLVMSPLCWISTAVTYIASVITNFTMVLSVSDPVLLLQYTQHYKIDTLTVLPLMMVALLDVPNHSSYDMSSVKLIVSGASTLKMDVKKTFLEKLFQNNVVLNHIYASTEAGVITTYKYVDPQIIIKSTSSGKLVSGAQLKVVDDNGKTVGPGVEGELRVKTDSMIVKYVRNPEATSYAFDSQGFFCTGDVGCYDENDFVYVLGRLSDRMQYKDNKICMAAVERLLLNHPVVHDTIIVAKQHPVDNQHPAAFIILKPNVNVTVEEIQAYINDRVTDNYKLRGGVHFIKSFPTLPNGKISKHILQTKLQE